MWIKSEVKPIWLNVDRIDAIYVYSYVGESIHEVIVVTNGKGILLSQI